MSKDKEIQEILAILDEEPESQPEKIALELGIDVDHVADVIEKHSSSNKPNSKLDVLEGQLSTLRDLYEIAQFEYKTQPTDKNALAVTSLMNTAQSIIKDIESFRDNTSLLRDLLKEVIQPFVTSLIQSVSENSRNLRAHLVKEVPGHEQAIDKAVKDFVQAYGVSSRKEYESLVDGAAEVLNVTKNDQKSVKQEGTSS